MQGQFLHYIPDQFFFSRIKVNRLSKIIYFPPESKVAQLDPILAGSEYDIGVVALGGGLDLPEELVIVALMVRQLHGLIEIAAKRRHLSDQWSEIADTGKEQHRFILKVFDRQATVAAYQVRVDKLGAVDVRLWALLFDLFLQFAGILGQVSPSDQNDISTGQGRLGLTKNTQRESFHIAPGNGGVESHDIQIAMKRAVLKAIIDNDDIDLAGLAEPHCCL